MRILSLLALGVVVMAAGGALFLGYRNFSIPSGEILGVQTEAPFWQSGMPLLGGSKGNALMWLSPDGSIAPIAAFADTDVAAAIAAPNAERFVVAVRKDGYSILWSYSDMGTRPEFLYAVRGAVSQMSFSSNSRYLAFLSRFQETSVSAAQASVFDMQTKTVQHLSASVRSIAWAADPEALIVTDAAAQAWYHEFSLAGTIETPKLLGPAASNAEFVRVGRRAAWVAERESLGVGLFATELASGEQRLIAEVGAEAPQGIRPVLRLNPSQGQAAVLLSHGAETENAEIMLVDLQSAAIRPVPFTATEIRWLSDTEILMKRQTPSGAELWKFDTAAASLQSLITEGYTSFAS